MGLLTVTIPADKIEFLKGKIDFSKTKAASMPEGESKKWVEAKYLILERFVEFLQKGSEEVQVFELTNQGMDLRSAANLDINMVLAKGGVITQLSDEALIAKIKDVLYKNVDHKTINAIFNETYFPLVFEWWEKKSDKSSMDAWKGVIKIPQSL